MRPACAAPEEATLCVAPREFAFSNGNFDGWRDTCQNSVSSAAAPSLLPLRGLGQGPVPARPSPPDTRFPQSPRRR